MAGHLQKLGGKKYKLWASAGTGAGQKRLRPTRTITAKDDQTAEKKLALFVAEVERNENPTSGKMTFAQFVERWRDTHAKHLAPKTRHGYNRMLDLRILKAIGHIRLDRLRPLHLLDFYEQLREPDAREDKGKQGPLTEQTILHYHRLISTLLELAVKWQLLPNNIAKRVAAPSVPDKELPSYTQEQVRRLMDKLEGQPYKYWLGVMIPLTCGLREGELFGLEWKHIDFDTRRVTIVQSSQYLPGEGVFTKLPKTRSGKRIVRLPQFIMPVLKAWKAEQSMQKLKLGNKWYNTDRVMTTWNGKAMYPGTMSQWFPAFLKENHLAHMNFHGTRHTFATLMDRSVISDADLSKLLGHTRVSTTKNMYTHADPGADDQAASIMDKIFSSKKRSKKRA